MHTHTHSPSRVGLKSRIMKSSSNFNQLCQLRAKFLSASHSGENFQLSPPKWAWLLQIKFNKIKMEFNRQATRGPCSITITINMCDVTGRGKANNNFDFIDSRQSPQTKPQVAHKPQGFSRRRLAQPRGEEEEREKAKAAGRQHLIISA